MSNDKVSIERLAELSEDAFRLCSAAELRSMASELIRLRRLELGVEIVEHLKESTALIAALSDPGGVPRLTESEIVSTQWLLNHTDGSGWCASTHGTMPDGSPNPNWFASFSTSHVSHIPESLARFLAESYQNVKALLAEVRERRAADLNAEDVEVLAETRHYLCSAAAVYRGTAIDQQLRRYLVPIDKLLAAHGVRS